MKQYPKTPKAREPPSWRPSGVDKASKFQGFTTKQSLIQPENDDPTKELTDAQLRANFTERVTRTAMTEQRDVADNDEKKKRAQSLKELGVDVD